MELLIILLYENGKNNMVANKTIKVALLMKVLYLNALM